MQDEAGELDERLATAAARWREYGITNQRLAELGRRIGEAHAELVRLQQAYAAELKDVQRLEGMSFTRVLATLRGKREDKLAVEQAQAHAAALRVQSVESALAALRHEQDQARERQRHLADAPATYQAVLDEKERYLCSSGDPRWGSLLEIADERGRLTGELAEVREAMAAAAAAYGALAKVQDRLASAESWSTWDVVGGGMASSIMKHSRLDEAAAAAHHADNLLAVLKTELVDVGAAGLATPQLVLDGFTRFVDVWFDNIFTDWAVGKRINEARYNVANCLGYVQHIQGQLHETVVRSRARLSKLEKERHGLLTRDLR